MKTMRISAGAALLLFTQQMIGQAELPNGTTFPVGVDNSTFGNPNPFVNPVTPGFEVTVFGEGMFSSVNWGRGILLRRPNETTRGTGIVWDRGDQNGAADRCNYFIAGPQNSEQAYSGDYFTGIFTGPSDGNGTVTNISRIDGNVQGMQFGNPVGTPGYALGDPKRGHTQYLRDVYLWRENGDFPFPSLAINYNPANIALPPPMSLQVDCQAGNAGTGTVRFSCLPTLTATRLIGCDADGDLTYVNLPSGGGITNSCTQDDYVTKTDGTTGNLECSQIFDDGTSIGIGISSGFGYTDAGAALLIPGGYSAPSTFKLYVNGVTRANGYLAISDERFKMDIKPLDNPLEKLKGLRGVSYNWRGDAHKERNFDSGRQIGFIAQELAKVVPEAVVVDDQGYYSVNYDMMIPLLTEAMKAQQSMIEDKQAQIDEQRIDIESKQVQIDELSERLAAIERKLGEVSANTITVGSSMLRIAPNPFGDRTTITYTVNCACQVRLDVTTADGKPLTTLVSAQREAGNYTYEWSTTDIAAGMYYCTLLVDGKPTVKRAVKVTR